MATKAGVRRAVAAVLRDKRKDNVEYRFVHGSRFSGKKKAQTVGEFLTDLGKKLGGAITPADVWEAAKDPNSPIHGPDFFEWNQRRAAKAHQLQQAAYLLRSIEAVFVPQNDGDEEVVTRAFPNLNPVGSRKQESYLHITDVLNDAAARRKLLARAMDEANVFVGKYGHLKELVKIVEAIRSTGRRVGRKKRKKK